MADALRQMQAVPPAHPLILDGFVAGAGTGLETIRAPMVAMIHHPLAHETGLSAARRAHLRASERANVALVRHILVPSPATRDLLVAEYGADPACVTIAPPGVDRPALPPAPEAPPLILSVGILHPRKGHDVLLDALARLTDLDWRAVIVGSDYASGYGEALRRHADALGLTARLTFAGEVSPDRLDRLYAAASIFALATRFEGYGMVFAEALARGLPIVATKAGAVPDTVPAEAGLLVPPGDAPATAAALRRLLTEPATRARCAEGAARAGAALPGWDDTARIASAVLAPLADR
jgi:glycosyltransferase involved in cell wall biosynthesis